MELLKICLRIGLGMTFDKHCYVFGAMVGNQRKTSASFFTTTKQESISFISARFGSLDFSSKYEASGVINLSVINSTKDQVALFSLERHKRRQRCQEEKIYHLTVQKLWRERTWREILKHFLAALVFGALGNVIDIGTDGLTAKSFITGANYTNRVKNSGGNLLNKLASSKIR